MAKALSRDPYKNFRFKVYFDSDEEKSLVAYVNNVSGLSWSVDVVSYGEGGNYQSQRKVPGQISYEPVTLSRGITADNKFKDWAEAVWNYSNNNQLKGLRKRLIIALCDEKGEIAVKYTLEKCWVSGYNTLPELSADDNAIAIEEITVEHEGWTHEVLGTSAEEGARKRPA
ncbi:phage tail protein [Desulfonema magnum]|uniref:Phage tail protein n=1 Tax=Desulfonema magnum TaxID=45655 RepID=A0A975BP77_9BACT|nr:phage tail protein [Desulfonema magnum]QTA89106.1 Phage tail protein [Desulfonema magnum]